MHSVASETKSSTVPANNNNVYSQQTGDRATPSTKSTTNEEPVDKERAEVPTGGSEPQSQVNLPGNAANGQSPKNAKGVDEKHSDNAEGEEEGKTKVEPVDPKPPSSIGGVLHIIEVATDGSDTPISSIDHAPFAAKDTTLATVRAHQHSKIPTGQSFCYPNRSEAPDSLLLATYLNALPAADEYSPESSSWKNKVPNGSYTVYILGKKKLAGSDILSNPPFMIHVAKWQSEGGNASQGSIHSNTFGSDAVRIKLLKLSGLRKRISNMSRLPSVHTFCTPAGVTVDDEELTLADYLTMGAVQEAKNDSTDGVPSVMVLFKLNLPTNQPNVTPQIPDSIKDSTALDPNLSGGKTATPFAEKTRTSMIEDVGGVTGTDPAKGAGCLTEDNWNEVLRNCGIMYGWVVNRTTNSIVRAPKAAFKLRAKRAQLGSTAQSPDFATLPPPKPAPTKAEPVERAIELESIAGQNPKADPVFGIGQSSQVMARGSPTAATGILTQPDVTGDSNQATPDSSTSTTATMKSSNPLTTRTSGQANDTQPSPPTAPAGDTPSDGTPQDSSPQDATPPDTGTPDAALPTGSTPASTPAGDGTVVSAKNSSVMPSFQVNDNSRIDIMACAHEFETSMARNDFSSQSTEASLSAGYAGFSVAVSAGYASSKSISSKTADDSYTKTLVAKYLFPRADIYLDPDDLEPTTELADLLKLIAKNKNIKDLRRLNAEFGQLFCQSVTVGGRLLSTKTMTSTTQMSEQEQKEQFKVSVGVSVQTPIGIGAEMKHSQEQGSSTSTNTTNTSTNENNVFEAVGGDTVLAASPAAWASTVGDYRNWRIINRDGLVPLSSMISGIPGYQRVRDYFVQAVPALSKYIELDEGREVLTRLRLTSPGHGLSLHNAYNPAYYLAHTPGETLATPKLMCLAGQTQNTVWSNANDQYGPNAPPLFRPSSFRAPVIQGYENNMVTPNLPYGVQYDQCFMNTMWTIVSPFNEALQHEGRVILKTVPISNPIAAPTTAATSQITSPVVSSLVVFRNQQGVFLPAMSDIEESQYWRILKTGASSAGENIKEGDEVRFAWAFADQTVGFRDYQDDVFGRRRNQCPAELEKGILYLKLPWPRFESLNNKEPNSMAMSPDAGSSPVPTMLRCLNVRDATKETSYTYLMEEVKFRIDTVANNGFGDTGDYMLKDVKEYVDPSQPQPPPFAALLAQRVRRHELNLLARMFFL